MKAVDFIKMSLEMGKGWIMGLVTDMKDAPTSFPTSHGGNHPLWVVGHLTYSEYELVKELIQGEPNPLADWKDVFGQGSEPVADPGHYPSFDDVLAKFEQARTETVQFLDSITDDDLDKPSKASDEMKEYFGTIGQCLSALCLHFMYHGGQVADARRAAGRKPMMG